jgi:hypothetical protein
LLVRNNNSDNISFRKTFENRDYRSFRNPGRFEIEIADKLGLNQDQREKLQNFSSEFHDQKAELKKQIIDIKEKYFTGISASNTDPVVLNELADSLGALHSAMIKLDFQHYKNVKSVCTKEQAIRLDSLGRLHMNNIRGENCQNDGRRHKRSGKNRQLNN